MSFSDRPPVCQCAHALHDIKREHNPSTPAFSADGLDVDAKTIPELNVGDGHDACVLIDQREDRVWQHPATDQLSLAKLDAIVSQRHPRVHVRGVLPLGPHHVVCALPIQTLRHQRHAVRSASRERYPFGRAIDELGRKVAYPVGLIEGRAGGVGPVQSAVDDLFDRCSTSLGHGRHAGMVHVYVVASERDQAARFKWIHSLYLLKNRTINGSSVVM